eukprot:tig00001003_g6276.t1
MFIPVFASPSKCKCCRCSSRRRNGARSSRGKSGCSFRKRILPRTHCTGAGLDFPWPRDGEARPGALLSSRSRLLQVAIPASDS